MHAMTHARIKRLCALVISEEARSGALVSPTQRNEQRRAPAKERDVQSGAKVLGLVTISTLVNLARGSCLESAAKVLGLGAISTRHTPSSDPLVVARGSCFLPT